MINIAVCDDERTEIQYLSGHIHKWADERGIAIHLLTYDSAESFLFAYEDFNDIDILLLDIQMKSMDGVELARTIRVDNDAMQIVFITGYPDFMSQGYDVSALHYIIKPVKMEKLFELLDKATERIKKAEQSLLVQTNDTAVKILLNDILYIESFAHYVAVHTKNASTETRANISDIQESAGNAFVRCHRSYIVGLNHISRITKTEVVLDNGISVPLSRRLYTEINLAFIEYHKRGRQ